MNATGLTGSSPTIEPDGCGGAGVILSAGAAPVPALDAFGQGSSRRLLRRVIAEIQRRQVVEG